MMRKMLKKITITLIILSLALGLTSCIRFRINYNYDYKKVFDYIRDMFAKTSEPQNEVRASESIMEETDTYDEIVSLDGYVKTLSKYKLPEIGDVIGGFTAKMIFDYEEKNAKVVMFEHKKTGAVCFLISNDDVDKSACLGFNTLAYDNKGLPHVFEHATLGGSKRYPSANLFFEMLSKTYSTYLNANTLQQATTFPMGSLSDEQLFEYFKFYIDGVFDPNIIDDEKLLEREAYRYSLADNDSDINLSGVVYSEMSAHESIIQATAFYNSARALYEGSFLASEVGGVTSDIPKITHEELKNFHDTYYHPSNMVMTLYGDIDYEKYLIYANDEYLSLYDRKDIDKSDKNYVEGDNYIEKLYDFPVASGSVTENSSIITYALSCKDMTLYEAGIFDIVLEDLQSDAGYLRTRIEEKLPYADFYINNMLDCEKPYIEFCFENVNEDDKAIVKEIVEGALNDEVEYGFDIESVNSYIDINEIDREFEKDSHGFTYYLPGFYSMAFKDNGKDLLGYFKYAKGKRDVEKRYIDGTVQELTEKYLGGNGKVALTVTSPKSGLAEKKNEEKAASLRDMKDNMIKDEIDNLIKDTKDYDKWVEYVNSYTIIDKVRVASVSALPEYVPKCYAYEENVEGIRFIRSDIDDIKFSNINILLDASSVPYEDTLKLKLLSELLLYLPTTNYNDYDLSNEFSFCCYNYSLSLYNNIYYNGGYNPYLTFKVTVLDKNIDKVFELIRETLFETKFEDVEKLKTLASRNYNFMKNSFESEPSNYATDLAYAISDPDYLYNVHVDGIDYMNYLHEVSKLSNEDLKELLLDCKNLLDSILNKDKMVCEIISNFGMVSNIKNKVLKLTEEFREERREPISYDENLRKFKNNIAIVSSGNVQYNYIVLPLREKYDKYDSRLDIMNCWLDSDILYPEFRVKRSCYGANAETNRDYMSIGTYRDPNLKETYDAYSSLIDIIKSTDMSEEAYEDYRISAFSKYSYPSTKFGAASSAIDEMLTNCDEKMPERLLRYMRDIKEATIDDMKELKELYIEMLTKGYKISAGNNELIAKNSDLFDEIIYDYIN